MSRLAPELITAYHGTKDWNAAVVLRAASVKYLLARGTSVKDAEAHARGLLKALNDFDDLSVLSMAMYQAQAIGVSSPFVSTSRKRDVAISFALENDTPGYCVTIVGPENRFYDFNAIRERLGIPHRPEFRWLEELGIPVKVRTPFRVLRVDRVTSREARSRPVRVPKDPL